MKVAVTGATGFIGRHVLSELARHSIEVVAVALTVSAVNFGAVDVETVQLDM